jgi:hypothetical protein
MKQFITLTIAFLASFWSFSQENWPKIIKSDDGSVISIFEPEPDYLAGNEFTGRAAVSVRKTPNEEPVFGAILFTASMKNRKSNKNIQVESLRITRLKFSGDDEQTNVDHVSSEIEGAAPGWNWGMTTDELQAKVDNHEAATSEDGFNNAPPKIIYATKPSTLVLIDGEPRVLYDKDLATDKVVNTPNVIFREKGTWHLYAGGNWYESKSITNGWRLNNRLTGKVKSVNDAIKKQEKENNQGKEQTARPKYTDIIVSTVPAELIQTDGEPEYKNVEGTSLLYVSNSPNDIFKDINTQRTYIVIAGRWYSSRNINGPWEYIPADKLPADFARIPEGSDKDAVLANVAGTPAAETATLDAAIPQTARVSRQSASITVEYDGEPYFAPIKGTSLELAENANVTVIRDTDENYFALDNGIWFISDDPYGPWSVANDRPRDLERIPASSPAYYSRHAYIYDVTPDYVYMGYTPGYLGSYVYGPTVVYGTGYYYRPWFHRVYYPRPVTWGFGFMYDPWYGWNFNFGYNFGYMYVGFWYDRPAYYGWGGGWFGPYRYCPSYRRPYWYGGGYYGRGDYYYGRNRYDNRNYYGSGGRRERPYYGRTTDSNRPPRFGNNLYADQRGVTTRNLNRVARVYTPGEQTTSRLNTSRPVNSRYTNRLSDGNRTGDARNPRRPELTNPQGSRNENSDFRDTYRNRRPQQPVDNSQSSDQRLTNPRNRRELPNVTSPRRNDTENERPRLQLPSGERVQRRSLESGQPERAPQPVERPAQRERQPAFERPSAPRQQSLERPSFENRSPSPSVRPSVENRAPVQAPRPSVQSRPPSSSQGGSNSGSGGQIRRPDRR